MAILAVLFVHGVGIGHITITCHGYNACVEKYQSIDEFYLRAEVMRQQCVVPCYGETRSQLTIQVDCGLVKSQLSLPRRTTADNLSFMLFFEKTRFSISLLSLYL
jgi:hypothetical protein